MAKEQSPTQQFVSIKEIKNGVVYLKDGSFRKVLIVSGVNFDLKSEDEQNIILKGFQQFLNTIDYSVQFFIHSRKMNIDGYLKKIESRKDKETSELLQIQINEYVAFIKMFVKENSIISKSFFVVVPYDSLSVNSGALGSAMSFLSGKKSVGDTSAGEALEKEHIEQLERRVDQVIEGLSQVELRVVELNDDELVELYYNLYNPQLVEKKDFNAINK